jgi:hypothetical protein
MLESALAEIEKSPELQKMWAEVEKAIWAEAEKGIATAEIEKAIWEIVTEKEKAGEGPQILRSIASMEAAFRAENDLYIAASAGTKGAAVSGNGWHELGFDSNPFSEYYFFEVKTGFNGQKFVAIATLKQNLGNAKAGDYASIDERDNRTVSSSALQALIPNWK